MPASSIRQLHGKVVLTLSNDGVVPSLGSTRRRRGGLDNLAARMAAADGEIVVRADQDGWFQLIARCPVRREPRAAGSGCPAHAAGHGKHRSELPAHGLSRAASRASSTGIPPVWARIPLASVVEPHLRSACDLASVDEARGQS